MNRESITLHFKQNLFSENQIPKGFEYIQETQIYFDSEKKYCDYEVIIKRVSDGKFFKGQYTGWGHGINEVEMVWVETFPKAITTVIYE